MEHVISTSGKTRKILDTSGRLLPDISRLPWPETMPMLRQDQDVSGTDDSEYPNTITEWVKYAIPILDAKEANTSKLMRDILYSLIYSVSQYRKDKDYLSCIRVRNHLEDWNYVVKTSYNVAIYLLGYTEEQFPYIGEAAKYLLSVGIANNLVEASYDGTRFWIVYPSNNPKPGKQT